MLASSLRSWAQEPAGPSPAIMAATLRTISEAPDPQNRVNAPPAAGTGNINGTIVDANGDTVPGATVLLEMPDAVARQSQTSDDNGFFEFRSLQPGVTYHVTVTAKGFDPWVSPPILLVSGQFFEILGIKLKLEHEVSSVTVVADTQQIATEQVALAERQRIFGLIPNFYVVYDSVNAVPLTTKLKFQMAFKVSVDPVNIVGAAALAAMDQAGDRSDYPQGWKGYAQRFGAEYTDGLTDVMFGGAILPWLLHQDPRYFYQGTGTIKSRARHALASPFICKGDDGHQQVNASSMGGDLISSSISNFYYPKSNRGASMVFTSFALNTGVREMSSLLQEFLVKKLTPSAKR